MPGPYHEEPTYVGRYERSGGGVVEGHPSHALVGTPVFVVLFREKNLREPGGTKKNPRNAENRWHIRRRYRSAKAAERERRRLMRRGYHAVVEGIGGRSEMPSLRELLSDAQSNDRLRRRMRRE
jgi:hypothetical protein